MAIWLTTGLPGHGKTLRTITEVEDRRIAEGRVVYYHGISDLQLDWHPLDDPELWYTVPDGSIIVIDECQQIFPNRPSGSHVPQKVSEFETHRHRGLDVVLITQHPKLIDNHIRRLIERHIHVMRPFGMSYAVVYEWQVCTDPDRTGVDKHAQKSRWRLPKDAFGTYKSATVHTVKKRLPFKIFWLPILGVIIGGSIWYAKNTLAPPQESIDVHELTQIPNSVRNEIRETLQNALPDSAPRPVTPPPPLHPYGGHDLYISGYLNDLIIISADRDSYTVTITSDDLRASGYYLTPLTPCLLRITYGKLTDHVHCRGREHQYEQPQHRDDLIRAISTGGA